MQITIFPEPGYTGDRLWTPDLNNWHESYLELRRQLEDKGHSVSVHPHKGESDAAIYFDLPKYACPSVARSICVMLEPPVVNPRQYDRLDGLPFKRILTFCRDICDSKRIFYSPFPYVPYDGYIIPDKTENCCAISSYIKNPNPDALYHARELAYLSMGRDLHLYGRNWHLWPELHKVDYKGEIHGHKIPVMARYRQAIVFENCSINGYASEKYWDAKQAGCEMLHRGWVPDYPMEEACPPKWAKRIVDHLEAII